MWKKRILAFLLCVCMLIPSELATIFAEGGTAEGSETSGTEVTIPKCVCESDNEDLTAHSDTECALKAYCIKVVAEKTASEIYDNWDKYPDNAKSFILTYMSWNSQYADKLAELNTLISDGGSAEEPELPESPFEEDVPKIYGVVEGKAVVVYGEAFPEGTVLSLTAADAGTQLKNFGVLEENISAYDIAFAYDIKILQADSTEWQPEESEIAIQIPVNAAAGTSIGILHTHNGATTYLETVTVQDDGTIIFFTDGFSEFVGFTVDFHYEGVDYSIAGMSSILLSELFAAMSIQEDAAKVISVIFSDSSLLQVTKEENNWRLTSLMAFDTEETLVITFDDGRIIIINVTDEPHTSTLDFGDYGIEGYFSSNPPTGLRKPTVYLYWGDSESSFTNDQATKVITNAWMGLNSSYYWFEIKGFDVIAERDDPYTPTSGTPGINALAMGVFGIGNPKVHVKVWDRTITDNTNEYCAIEQASEFVARGDTIRRNVKIYLDNYEKQTISNILFPHRAVGSSTPNGILASDITTVTSNNSSYFPRASVGGAATVVASGDTYHVYLVTRGTIKYDANGGSGAPGSQYKYYDVNLTLSSTEPKKDYSIFKGWATTKARADAGTVDYVKGSTYTANLTSGSSTTLYAVWEYANANYTVKHLQQNVAGTGYDEVTADRQTITAKAYDSVTPQVKTYTGFTSPTTQTVMVNGDGNTVIEYKYDRQSFTVTTQKGTGISSVDGSGSYKYGTSVTINATVSNGYTWVNWTTGNSNVVSQQYTFTMPASNVTYTANAKKTEYSIAYNLDGGTVSKENPSSYTSDTATFTLNNPTKPGYTFAGWTGTGLTETKETVEIAQGSTGNRNYTANWTPISYTITYDSKGGSNVSAQTYVITNNVKLADKPTKTGYTFIGWKLETAEGNWEARTYSASENVGINKYGNVTLKAIWNPVTYTITYDLNDGVVEGNNPATYKVTDSDITLINPKRQDYDFLGWTGSNGSEPQLTVTIPTGSTGDKSYTANWKKSSATYTIEYHLQNVDSTGYTVAQVIDDKEGVIGQKPETGDKLEFTGFTYDKCVISPDSADDKILSDGTTRVIHYYTRNAYEVTYELKYPDKTVTTVETLKYGADITLAEAVPAYYSVKSEWKVTDPTNDYSAVPSTMPAENITLTRELEFNGGSLKLEKSGLKKGDSASYWITGTSEGNKTISVNVTVVGADDNDSTKDILVIHYLPAGDYAVTEDGWSWEYTNTCDTPQPVTMGKGTTATVAFTNTKINTGWLSGEARKNNKFPAKR